MRSSIRVSRNGRPFSVEVQISTGTSEENPVNQIRLEDNNSLDPESSQSGNPYSHRSSTWTTTETHGTMASSCRRGPRIN